MTKRNPTCWLRRIGYFVTTNDNGVGMDIVARANGLLRTANAEAHKAAEAKKAAKRKGGSQRAAFAAAGW